MARKLSDANAFMRDPAVRRASVLRSVATSSAIEGVRAPFKTNAGKLAKRDFRAVTTRHSPKS